MIAMQKLITGTILALALASGQALAQATPPAAIAAVEAKFKAADKNTNGTRGAELDAYKTPMVQADSLPRPRLAISSRPLRWRSRNWLFRNEREAQAVSPTRTIDADFVSR